MRPLKSPHSSENIPHLSTYFQRWQSCSSLGQGQPDTQGILGVLQGGGFLIMGLVAGLQGSVSWRSAKALETNRRPLTGVSPEDPLGCAARGQPCRTCAQGEFANPALNHSWGTTLTLRNEQLSVYPNYGQSDQQLLSLNQTSQTLVGAPGWTRREEWAQYKLSCCLGTTERLQSPSQY